jgi:hypothetical protein
MVNGRGQDSLSSEIARLRREIDKLRRRGPQLAYSSVEGGAITWNDDSGTQTMLVGVQPDGTNAPTVVNGPVPPGASDVSVEQGVNSIICGWFGTFIGGVAAPLDYARAEFHVSTIGPGFTPDVVGLGDPSTTLLATLESPRGGRAVISGLPYVEHWVKVVIRSLSGKFSVESAAVSITPKLVDTEDIAFGAVTAESLAAGAVTAEKIDVQVLQAGMTVTGRIQVGASYWTPTELVFPQPDGTFTRFSANGSGINEISGNVRAKSLTVEQNLNILGTTNKISGTLEAANGITPPDNPPTVSFGWQVDSSHDTTTFGATSYGLCEKIGDANTLVLANSFFGGGVSLLTEATGADVTGLYNTTGVPAWGGSWPSTDFRPTGGIVATATHYFVLGQDAARSFGWYLYKLSPTDFGKVAELYIGPSANVPNRPSLGYDGTSILVGYAVPAAVNFIDINPTTVAVNGASSIPLANIGNLFHFSRGTYDWGDGKVRYVIGAEASGTVYTYDAATGGGLESYLYSWVTPFNEATLRGMFYSPSKARWITDGASGKIVRMSPLKSATVVNARYTWYDSVGTVRETTVSPLGTGTIPARARIVIQTDTPPDSGVTDTGLVDKANRVGIYAAVGAGTLKLQSYLPVDPVTFVSTKVLVADTITTGGAVAPGSNTFIGGTSSPGAIQSAASDGSGKIWKFDGSGAARLGDMRFSSAGVRTDLRAWTGNTTVATNITTTTPTVIPSCSVSVNCNGPSDIFEVVLTLDANLVTPGAPTLLAQVFVDGVNQNAPAAILRQSAASDRVSAVQAGIILTGLTIGVRTIDMRAYLTAAGATYQVLSGSTILVKRI